MRERVTSSEVDVEVEVGQSAGGGRASPSCTGNMNADELIICVSGWARWETETGNFEVRAGDALRSCFNFHIGYELSPQSAYITGGTWLSTQDVGPLGWP
jgi:hypothetical protein